MRRACKLTTKFITHKKHRAISALLKSYRSAVNFYIKQIWFHEGSFCAKTLARLTHTRLSERYKSAALKQAFEVVLSTRKSARELNKRPSLPFFNGRATLDAKFVSIESGNKSFDLVVRLSTLNKGHRIIIPTRRTEVLNKWNECALSKLVQGCSLGENSLTVWVEIPDQEVKKEGKILGVDIGINKLIADSDERFYGTGFKKISSKIRRRKPGSKGMTRARSERDQYINKTVKELPWEGLSVIGVEELKNLKRGKRRGRGKSFRKAIAPWTYRRVLRQIGLRAQENRVLMMPVPSAYTSQMCPMCNEVHKENRRGEHFVCCKCGYTADADYVGARNVLVRTLATIGSVESPVPIEGVGCHS